MKMLFVLRHAMYLRIFESTIRKLLERGHEVERFLGAFVRPFGLTRPCTPLLAAAIEATASVPRQRAVSPSLPRQMLRVALAPKAWACSAAYSLREVGRTVR
jgi:hypothetical protein